jgi:serine O-acetyltransferase
VVGIPGRVVLPESQRRITQQGIDLDHHLMPDPVGKAISCLLDRIAYLEKHLGVSAEAQALPATNDCVTCTETCDPAHVAVNLKRTTH